MDFPNFELLNARIVSVLSRSSRIPTSKRRTVWQEETERQERCARGDSCKFAKNVYKLQEKEKLHSIRFPMSGFCWPRPQWKLEEREFVVDFGASMHMVSRKDLNSAEFETGRISKSPTTMTTANGEVLTKEATVYVRESDLFVTEMLLEDTPAVLSLGKLCEDHGENYHWTSAQKPHIINHGGKSGLSTSSSTFFTFSYIFIAGSRNSHGASRINKKCELWVRKYEETRRMDQRKPKTNKNDDNVDVRGNLSHDLPEGLEEFKEINTNDYWNVDVDWELSDTWTGFTRFTVAEWKTTGWIYINGEETDKKTNDIQTRLSVARDLERYVWRVETQRKAKVGDRETKARQRQKIAWYLPFIDPSWGCCATVLKGIPSFIMSPFFGMSFLFDGVETLRPGQLSWCHFVLVCTGHQSMEKYEFDDCIFAFTHRDDWEDHTSAWAWRWAGGE